MDILVTNCSLMIIVLLLLLVAYRLSEILDVLTKIKKCISVKTNSPS